MATDVIKLKHLPVRLPVTHLAVWWLFLDHFHVDRLWWGVYWACAIANVVLSVAAMVMQRERTPVFQDDAGLSRAREALARAVRRVGIPDVN